MTKLRNVLAAALLTVAFASLSPSVAATAQDRAGFDPIQPVAGECWVYMGGRWWLVPC